MKIIHVRTIALRDLVFLASSEEGIVACRQLRAPLLDAFDIYKSNVAYGIVKENEATHQAVAAWYRRLLDLDPIAIGDVPSVVAAYVGKGVTR